MYRPAPSWRHLARSEAALRLQHRGRGDFAGASTNWHGSGMNEGRLTDGRAEHRACEGGPPWRRGSTMEALARVMVLESAARQRDARLSSSLSAESMHA